MSKAKGTKTIKESFKTKIYLRAIKKPKLSTKELALKFNVSTSTVFNLLKVNNYDFGKKHGLTIEQEEKIISLHKKNKHLSIRKLAEKISFAKKSKIHNVLLENGLRSDRRRRR